MKLDFTSIHLSELLNAHIKQFDIIASIAANLDPQHAEQINMVKAGLGMLASSIKNPSP